MPDEKGRFRKGEGGRPKGSKNKSTLLVARKVIIEEETAPTINVVDKREIGQIGRMVTINGNGRGSNGHGGNGSNGHGGSNGSNGSNRHGGGHTNGGSSDAYN